MVVTLNPYSNCGKCPSCRNGRVNACEHNETMGVQRNGAMCEYVAMPWQKVIPAAAGMTPKECALIEPMSVGFHAVNRAQVAALGIVQPGVKLLRQPFTADEGLAQGPALP